MSLTVDPSDKNANLKIPTLVNSCAVNADDVLLRFVPKPAKPEVEQVVPISTSQPAKRISIKGGNKDSTA